jgi:predicted dehydrogenase
VHFGEYLPSWHPWEDYRHGYAARADLGGGVLLTQCHSLDYIQWLLGSAEAAWGMLARRSDLEVTTEDTAEIGLRFPGGVLASVHLDYAERPPSHRLEVSGAGGLIQVDLLGGLMRIYQAETDAWEEARLPADWERNTMFVEEMRNFLDMVEGRARPAASLEDGIRVMHLIAAVQESHRTGTLVSLPL